MCRVWLDSKAGSVRTHEEGKKHRENAAQRLQDQRKDREERRRDEEQLAEQLQRIDQVSAPSLPPLSLPAARSSACTDCSLPFVCAFVRVRPLGLLCW